MKHDLYVLYSVDAETGVVCLFYGGMTSRGVINRFKQHLKECFTSFRPVNDYVFYNRQRVRVAHYACYPTKEEACEAEKLLITWLRETQPFNLNISSGGQYGSLGHKLTDSQKTALSVIMKRVHSSPESRIARGAAIKEALNRPEVRARRSASSKEAHHKAKVEARLAFLQSEEGIKLKRRLSRATKTKAMT